ncbi:ATP-binding cassette domain-containing protein [Microbacterium sp. KSW4-11]|uniref:ATP-binding cassette domain-containing protein n=1 Tax=Microbacterium gawkjiense TaxID=3067309 RepID=A0ABU3G9A0_9MICO|nr:ATP-binding cassette domain-containing protein [Microbacterium sp. KSW4-11]MDT3316388.1 ATP-binding cassette domain-containing protein [Microbacterium sp. KSW4-11]
MLEVDGLTIDYGRGRSRRRVVADVSFSIAAGETLGLVGESGSGKSTIGKAILGLVPVAGGSIRFAGEEISTASGRRRRQLTREIQVIYQDPYGSLNPARRIGTTLAEPLTVGRQSLGRREVAARVAEALDLVGLPASAADKLPGDFSGGQRQRIAIARAIIVRPRLIVCDEAVSALDLSIQAQVLNLLQDLSAELKMSYLFVSHDLAVVELLSSRIAVLYKGSLVENGDAREVFDHPRDPYTQLLRAAAPVPAPREQELRRDEFFEKLRARSGV